MTIINNAVYYDNRYQHMQSTIVVENMRWTLNFNVTGQSQWIWHWHHLMWCDDSFLCNMILLPSVSTLLNTWLVREEGQIYDLLSASSTAQIKYETGKVLQYPFCTGGHDEAIIDCVDHVFDTFGYIWFPFDKILSQFLVKKGEMHFLNTCPAIFITGW